MCEPHGNHTDSPEGHDYGNEDAGSQSLEQNVRQRFEESVGDEEYGQASIVLAPSNMQALL